MSISLSLSSSNPFYNPIRRLPYANPLCPPSSSPHLRPSPSPMLRKSFPSPVAPHFPSSVSSRTYRAMPALTATRSRPSSDKEEARHSASKRMRKREWEMGRVVASWVGYPSIEHFSSSWTTPPQSRRSSQTAHRRWQSRTGTRRQRQRSWSDIPRRRPFRSSSRYASRS